jgi:hypothetical protein
MMQGHVMAEINTQGFSGANNVIERFFSKKGILEPRVILNADVNQDSSLSIRKGKTLFFALANAHSLWAGTTCMLCAADGILYRVSQGIATSVGSISGPKYPLSYIDAEDKVYISNPYWHGIFDPSTNALSAWGVAVPPGPMLLSGDGNLPAGTYHICMTNVSGNEISGSGPIVSITLTSEGGIQILNRPSGALVWATDADEGIFYLVGATSKIVDIPTVEPLPSFLCSQPPYLENLCYAFGRIWGSSGSDVYYSMPFSLGLFKKASNVYHFEDTVTMIAKVPTGLFIGMEKRTRFLQGTIPEQMTQQDAGAGSVKGTLAYCNNMPELGWTLGTPEKDFVDVPVWLTSEGVVVGSPSGHFFNITKNKLKMGIPAEGASLYRNLEGAIQFLTSFKSGARGSGAGFRDEETYNAFKNGQIDQHEKTDNSMGTAVGFSDTATCTVTRGGVVI